VLRHSRGKVSGQNGAAARLARSDPHSYIGCRNSALSNSASSRHRCVSSKLNSDPKRRAHSFRETKFPLNRDIRLLGREAPGLIEAWIARLCSGTCLDLTRLSVTVFHGRSGHRIHGAIYQLPSCRQMTNRATVNSGSKDRRFARTARLNTGGEVTSPLNNSIAMEPGMLIQEWKDRTVPARR
jgi:hypothetical protein